MFYHGIKSDDYQKASDLVKDISTFAIFMWSFTFIRKQTRTRLDNMGFTLLLTIHKVDVDGSLTINARHATWCDVNPCELIVISPYIDCLCDLDNYCRGQWSNFLINFWVSLQENEKYAPIRQIPLTVIVLWNSGYCLPQKLKGGKVPWDKYDKSYVEECVIMYFKRESLEFLRVQW